jgi:predicted peptidase
MRPLPGDPIPDDDPGRRKVRSGIMAGATGEETTMPPNRLLLLVPLVCVPGCVTLDMHTPEPNGDPAPVPAAPAAIHGEMPTGFLFHTVHAGAAEHAVAVYVPRSYEKDPERKWPVIVFLNGSGECGVDGQKHLAVGLAPAIMLDRDAWPFICVFPQKPTQRTAWLDHDELVMAALDQTLASYSTDASRVYLTGLSQGGRGAWEIAARHPERFAAIAPICGWGDPDALAPALKSMPTWAFHGEKDTAVPPSGSKNLVAAMEKLGASPRPRLTLYPDAGHNSWDKAYRDEKLGEWFLRHTRTKGAGN